MAFPRNMLNDHEELVLDLRPHWVFLVPSGAAAVFGVVVGLLLIFWVDSSGTVGAVVNVAAGLLVLGTLGWFGWKYAEWATTVFALTSDRIVTRRGVVAKSGMDIPLERVNTVFTRQSVLERMVGAGDLSIESAGERGTNTFHNIRRPAVVQKEIYVQIEANENRKFDRFRGSGPDAGPTDATAVQGSIPDQIEQPSALHQRGVISDAEFQAKKAELLDRM